MKNRDDSEDDRPKLFNLGLGKGTIREVSLVLYVRPMKAKKSHLGSSVV